MIVAKSLRTKSSAAAMLAALAVSPVAQAGNGPLPLDALQDGIQARFEPTRQETRVTGRVAPALCFSFPLPQEWRAREDGPKVSLESSSRLGELDVGLRSARELGSMHPSGSTDLAGRDAAVLQRDYEDLLGRPAQSVSLASLASGALRWSATWIDAGLPVDSRAMTVETFIVPLSNDWVLELSLSDVKTREVYDALVQKVLAELSVQHGATCGG